MLLSACDTQANVASRDLALQAEEFKIERRIVFVNGITDEYLFMVEGRCSIEVQPSQAQLEVTCKIGPSEFAKHHLGLSDNMTYFSEQLTSSTLDPYHHRIVFRPQTLVPKVELDTSGSDQ